MPKPEVTDELPVAIEVLALEIPKEPAPLTDHHQEATAGMVVLGVTLQVTGQVIDPLREEGDLDLSGAGIAGTPAVLLDQLGFVFGGKALAVRPVEAGFQVPAPGRWKLAQTSRAASTSAPIWLINSSTSGKASSSRRRSRKETRKGFP